MAISVELRMLEGKEDIVDRQQRERADIVDPTDEYRTEKVDIDFGNAIVPIVLRRQVADEHGRGGNFLFVTLRDNPEWRRQPRDVWQAISADTLEKFCAVNDLQITDPPKPEMGNRYNFVCQVMRGMR